MTRRRALGACVLSLPFALLALAADPKPDPAPPVEAVVTDAAGNEVKLTGRLTAGVRTLAWLPQALLVVDFRDENSTTFAVGVSTFVPVRSVESVRYEETKQGKATVKTVRLKLAGHEKPLAGHGQFKGINQIGVEGTANGKAVKYLAGSPTNGVKEIAFPGAKRAELLPSTGPQWSFTVDQPRTTTPRQELSNLRVLVSEKGVEKVTSALPVRKGDPIPVEKIKRLDVIAVNGKAHLAVADVTFDDGRMETVVIPETTGPPDRPVTLLGFVGDVPVGWKLVPIHAITSLERK